MKGGVGVLSVYNGNKKRRRQGARRAEYWLEIIIRVWLKEMACVLYICGAKLK